MSDLLLDALLLHSNKEADLHIPHHHKVEDPPIALLIDLAHLASLMPRVLVVIKVIIRVLAQAAIKATIQDLAPVVIKAAIHDLVIKAQDLVRAATKVAHREENSAYLAKLEDLLLAQMCQVKLSLVQLPQDLDLKVVKLRVNLASKNSAMLSRKSV
jgi:hypothetical protein